MLLDAPPLDEGDRRLTNLRREERLDQLVHCHALPQDKGPRTQAILSAAPDHKESEGSRTLDQPHLGESFRNGSRGIALLDDKRDLRPRQDRRYWSRGHDGDRRGPCPGRELGKDRPEREHAHHQESEQDCTDPQRGRAITPPTVGPTHRGRCGPVAA